MGIEKGGRGANSVCVREGTVPSGFVDRLTGGHGGSGIPSFLRTPPQWASVWPSG